jgi:hypothetical protein
MQNHMICYDDTRKMWVRWKNPYLRKNQEYEYDNERK